MQTLYVAGLTQVVLGVQTLLWCETYNFASDLGLVPTLAVTYALCVLLERLSIAGGHFFQIWYIDASIERMEGQGDSVDIDDLFNQIQKMKRQ